MKLLCAHLPLPSYDVQYRLVAGSAKQCTVREKLMFPELCRDAGETYEGSYVWEKEDHAIFLVSPIKLRTVLHECWHLTRGILDYREADYGADYDEHAALLHEHVTCWTIDILRKAGILRL